MQVSKSAFKKVNRIEQAILAAQELVQDFQDTYIFGDQWPAKSMLTHSSNALLNDADRNLEQSVKDIIRLRKTMKTTPKYITK